MDISALPASHSEAAKFNIFRSLGKDFTTDFCNKDIYRGTCIVNEMDV